MSAEIVNLRRVRKAKQRQDAQARAEGNRGKFGRTKAEREATQAESERAAQRLDGLRRERDGSETDE